jgi:outer membrane lipoprotein-sorting protein
MTSPRISRALVVALATALAAGTLGCGLLEQAKGIADAAAVVSEFADRLGKAQNLTYTAEYSLTGDNGEKTTATFVQQPPNAAFVGKEGSFIFTPEALFFCGTAKGETTCQKSPNNATKVDAGDNAYIGAAMGAGFVTPELAIGVILAAGFVPGAKIEQSDETIAGLDTKCATASGLEAAASPGDKSAPKDFKVCVTEDGVLAAFTGTTTEGVEASIQLTNYSTSADAKAFAPPAGAKIVDTSVIQPGQ